MLASQRGRPNRSLGPSTLHLFLVLGTALVLEACATSSATTAAIDEFAGAAAVANEALQALDDSVVARLAEVQRDSVLAKSIRIRAEADTCLATSARCSLVYRNAPDSQPVAYAPASLVPRQRAIMKTIATYADALAAIQAADATREINASIDSVTGSIARLAALVPPFGSAGAAAAPVIGRVAKFGFSLWQEKVKRDATCDAVNAMNPVLQDAVALMSDTARFASLPAKRVLADTYDAAEKGLRDGSATGAELDAYVNAARSLDMALTLDDRQMFVALGSAHAALHSALTDPRVDPTSAVEAVQSFALRANEALAIAAELREVAD